MIGRDRGIVREAAVAAEGAREQQVEDSPAPVGVVLLKRSGALEPVSFIPWRRSDEYAAGGMYIRHRSLQIRRYETLLQDEYRTTVPGIHDMLQNGAKVACDRAQSTPRVRIQRALATIEAARFLPYEAVFVTTNTLLN